MKRLLRVVVLSLGLGLLGASAFAARPTVMLTPPQGLAQSEEGFLPRIQGYYDQFQFGVAGDCKDPANIWFKSAASVEDADLGKSAAGNPVFATMDLQLFPDSTYWLQYAEMEVIKETHEGGETHRDLVELYKTTREGSWMAGGDNQIILAGIGSGTPDKYTLWPGKVLDSIRFKFETALNDQHILGSSMNITRVWTSLGPNGKSSYDYCGIRP